MQKSRVKKTPFEQRTYHRLAASVMGGSRPLLAGVYFVLPWLATESMALFSSSGSAR